MTIKDLSREAERTTDLTALAARCKADVEVARKTLSAANKALAAAQAESQRLQTLIGVTMTDLHQVGEKLSKAKRLALEVSSEGKIALEEWTEVAKLRQRHERLTDVLSYVGAFSGPEADAEASRAEVAERLATADLFEAEGAALRADLMTKAHAVASADEGTKLDLSDSRSQKLLEQANDIRRRARSLEEDFSKKAATIAATQQDLSRRLFN